MKKTINTIFLFLLSLISVLGSSLNLNATEVMSSADTVTVSTETDLVAELSDLETISGTTKVINIDTDMVLSDTVSIDMSKGKNVVITSDNGATLQSTVSKKHFTILTGTSELTISNLTLIGNIEAAHIAGDELLDTVSSASVGGGILGTTAGKVTIDNVEFKYIKDKAVYITASDNVYIKNSKFIANSSEIEGSAVRAHGTGHFYIENTLFENNYARKDWQINYIGSTVFVGNTAASLTVNNSAFISNKSYQAGTNASATGGGAIAFKQVTGDLTVNNSYFYNNEVDALVATGQGNGTNSDGGAIYSWHSTGAISIQNSTFEKNTASDEGGAISIVCSSNLNNIIANNTFVENVSRGQQISLSWGIGNDGNDGGGAVEINGDDTTRSYANVINNTFYNNTAEKGKAILDGNRGGGISFRNADADVSNNIIVGNTASSTTAYNNINVESGSNVTLSDNVIDQTVASVFGTTTPTLEVNGNTNTAAGYEIKTLKIAPNNSSTATGLADGTAVGATVKDQRGFTRATLADIGAFDTLYVEYNGNGGGWLGNINEESYVNDWYYKNDVAGLATEKFNMANYNETKQVIFGDNPTRDGYMFVGWNTNALATTAMPTDHLEAYLTGITENKTLYAIWEEAKGTLIVVKTDEFDSSIPLPNTVFKLVDSNGDVVKDNIVTSITGRTTVPNLSAGSYQLIETQAPDGYLLDDTPRAVNIIANSVTTIRLTNEPTTYTAFSEATTANTGAIRVITTDIENDEVTVGNVGFTLFNQANEAVATLVTNESGNATVTDLASGSYKLVANGDASITSEIEILGDSTATTRIKVESALANSDTTNDIANLVEFSESDATIQPFSTGYFMFAKYYLDESNIPRLLAGAKFEIVNTDTNTLVGEYTTNAVGEIVLPTLPVGNYKITETYVPDGFKMVDSEKEKTFTITMGGAEIVEMRNDLDTTPAGPVGTGTLIKRDRHTQAAMPGVEFQLLDSTMTPIRTGLVTDANGQIILTDLAPGLYYWQETQALPGYIADTTPLDFNVTDGTNTQYITENALMRANITIVKVDSATNERLENAQFKVSGVIFGVNREYTITTNSSGEAVIANMLPGTYTVEELVAPAGYDMLTGTLTLVVEKGGTSANGQFVIQNSKTPLPTYEVSYDGNGHTGGTVPTDTAQYEAGDTVTVLTGTPTKPGFIFSGWTDGTSTYTAGNTFTMPAADVILTAVWVPTTKYQVIYDGNGNTGGIVPTDTTQYEAADVATVLTGEPTKPGFIFNGWSDGASTYLAGDTFTMPAADVTLTAIWTAIPVPVTYQVIYDGNGNTGGIVPTDTTQYEAGDMATVLTDVPTKTGFIFNGWSDGTNTYVAGDTFTMPAADVTLTAIWTAIPVPVTYQVIYDGNGNTGGVVPTDATQYEAGDTVTVLTDQPIKDGFTFAGWSDGASTYVAGDTFVMPAADVTLTAVWVADPAPITYRVMYDGNGHHAGTVPVDANDYLAGHTVTVSDHDLTRDGHTFLGWHSNDTDTVHQVGETFTMPEAHVTLTAVWQPETDEPGLVETGEHTQEMMLFGFVLVALGGVLMFIRKKATR